MKPRAAKLAIGAATEADIPDLVTMNDEVQAWHAATYPDDFRHPLDPVHVADFFRALLVEPGQSVLVARRNGAPVGYVWFTMPPSRMTPFRHPKRRLLVHHVCVHSGFRRQGVGRQLFARMRAEARAEGVHEMTLDTWAANTAAQAFFATEGFEPYRLTLRHQIGERGRPAGNR